MATSILNKKSTTKLLSALLLMVFFGASSSNAYAWRWTGSGTVTGVVPFNGNGFDVMPTAMGAVTGCTGYGVRVQAGYPAGATLTDADVKNYLAIVLTAHAASKPLQFIISDADCYVYRIVLN